MTQAAVAFDTSLVRCGVYRVVVPVVHRYDVQSGTPAHNDLDVLGERRRTLVAQDDRRAGVLAGLDHDVGVGA